MKNSINKSGDFVLNPKTDFTPKQLKEFLNNKYGTKTGGRPFTNADIYTYTKRGKLPHEYGDNVIQVIYNESIGVKILRLL